METVSLKNTMDIGLKDWLANLKATKVIPQKTMARMTARYTPDLDLLIRLLSGASDLLFPVSPWRI